MKHLILVRRSIVCALGLLFLIAGKSLLYAYPSGITGLTASGCTSCHGSQNSGTSVSVVSQSGNFTVNTGGQLQLTLIVAHSQKNAAGCNISVKNSSNVNVGTLTPASNSGLQSTSGELTHTQPKTFNNNEASFSFTWTAPTTPGTYSLRAVGNAVNSDGTASGDAWNFLSNQPVTITVSAAPSIAVSAPAAGVNWCAGSSRSIAWTASNLTGTVAISASSDGGQTWNVPVATGIAASANTYSWDIPSSAPLGSNWRVRVISESNPNVGDTNDGAFSVVGGPVSITQQPSSGIICLQVAHTLSVQATGPGLSYQWRKNGQNIGGATQSSYSISAMAVADTGRYDVVVTSQCGASSTSEVATLGIRRPPVIVKNISPVGYVCAGQDVRLSINVQGEGVVYQWYRNGTPIQGATDSAFVISSMDASKEGSYWVVASGACNPAASSDIIPVLLGKSPSIVSSPQSTGVCRGTELRLVVSSLGTDRTFQWKRNGSPLPNGRDSVFVIPSFAVSDTGSYVCEVRSSCGTPAESTPARITFSDAPVITTQPKDVTVAINQQVQLSVVAPTATAFAWSKNGSPLPGQQANTLVINSAATADAGTYTCTVSNACGQTVSASAVVSVTDPSETAVLASETTLLEFSEVDISAERALTVSNTGEKVGTISQAVISGADAAQFTVLTSLPVVLQPGQSVSLQVRYTPSSNTATAALALSGEGFANTLSVDLSGEAFVYLQSENTVEDFGTVEGSGSAARTVSVSSLVDRTVTITGITVTPSEAFSVQLPSALPLSVAPLADFSFDVVFTAVAEGEYTGTIQVQTSDRMLEIPVKALRTPATSVGEDRTGTQPEVVLLGSPFTDRVRALVRNTVVTRAELYSAQGHVLASSPVTAGVVDISAANLSSGVYMLVVRGAASAPVLRIPVVVSR